VPSDPHQVSAVLSADGRYRYRLTRHLEPTLDTIPGKTVVFVMLNPSTADAELNDPTTTRCIGYAAREHAEWLHLVNLYAYRTPHPKVLAAAHRDGVNIVGNPDADRHLGDVLSEAGSGLTVIAGWGNRPAGIPEPFHRAVEFAMLDRVGPTVALKVTGQGAPWHPLYLAADLPLLPYT